MPYVITKDYLVSLENATNYLGIQSSSNERDNFSIDSIVRGASAFVKSYLERDLVAETSRERYKATHNDFILTKRFPIISVDSLYLDGKSVTNFSFDDSKVYLDDGNLMLYKIDLVYSAGYHVLPADLTLATLKLVELWYKSKGKPITTSQSIHGDSVSYAKLAIPEDVRIILNRYRRIA